MIIFGEETVHEMPVAGSAVTATRPRVLVVGAGAIGALFGSRAGVSNLADVDFICRSNYDHVKKEGVVFDSTLFGRYTFTPCHVYKSIETAGAESSNPWDYLFVSIKALSSSKPTGYNGEGYDAKLITADLIRPLVKGPDTSIVLMQNGVEIDGDIAKAYPDNEIISGVVYAAASQLKSGNFRHQTLSTIHLGRVGGGKSAQLTQLVDILKGAGCEAVEEGNIELVRWHKILWNSAVSGSSVMAGCADTRSILVDPYMERVVRDLMEEAQSVSEARLGQPFPDHLMTIDKMIVLTKTMDPYRPSMTLDFMNGRPMETEAIFGNLIRTGKELGVATPRMDMAYSIIRHLDIANMLKHQSQ
eukprot:Clim_evm14s154 gene=Clim_evmTU14s154